MSPHNVIDGVRSRFEPTLDWMQRLGTELAELPDTLQRLRVGAANFEVVSQRLERASLSLEEMTELYQSTIAESTRRSAEAAETLRSQIDALARVASPDAVSTTITEMQRTFESLADLNPLWPSRRPKPDQT